MNRHIWILEQWIQSATIDRRLGEISRERILMHDHHEQKEHLHDRDNGDNVGNQLSLALPIRIDGAGSENRQQRDPKHD